MESSSSSPSSAIWDRFDHRDRLAINLTLTCNISCAHCIVESSPHRKERLSDEAVDAALRFGQLHGKRHVTFSGGEVFLFVPQLCRSIARARELGYVVDVESNGFWARSEEIARERLRPLVSAGVSGLSLSCDAYHVKFFPLDRTIHAARAARSHGLLTEINFCPSEDAQVDSEIQAALRGAGEPFIENELLSRGRGTDLYQIEMRRHLDEIKDCDSLTTTLHATGDLYACCELDTSSSQLKETPVFLGSLRDAEGGSVQVAQRREAIVSAFHDSRSPAYFRRLVAEHPQFVGLGAQRFHNICHFCTLALSDPERVEAIREVLCVAPSGAGEQGEAGAS